MSRLQFLLLILLLVVLIASGRFLEGRHPGLQEHTVSPTGPDSFASGVRLDIMDAGGKLRYRITADSMAHYPYSELLQLANPLVDMQQRNGNTWHLRAEQGETSDAGDRIRLLGSVDIRRNGAAGPLRMRTRDLLVRPQQGRATTDSAVTISAPGQRVEAVGMDADINNNTLQLRGRVRGRFDAAG